MAMSHTHGPFNKLSFSKRTCLTETEADAALSKAFPDKSETWRRGYKAVFFPWFFEPDPECRQELRAGVAHTTVQNPFSPPLDTDEKRQQYADWLVGNATGWADMIISVVRHHTKNLPH